MEGHEIGSPDWFVFFNVMYLSLVQTVLYKQHYNAMKLTFACLAAIFGGETAAFGLSTKTIPSLNQEFFLIIYSKIFLFYLGMPENGNPCASIVVEGCPSSKKRNFWVPKKTQFSSPKGGKDCAPIDVECPHNFESSH